MTETNGRLFDDVDNNSVSSENYCLGCLCGKSERKLNNYTFLCGPLKEIFKSQGIPLCYLCKKMAQHVDNFIQNAQSNQILLENFDNTMEDSLKSIILPSPLINLERVLCSVVDSSEKEVNSIEETCSVLYSSNLQMKVKVEIKEEVVLFDNAEDFLNKANDAIVKEESVFPLDEMLKEELPNENSDYSDNDNNSDHSTQQHNRRKNGIIEPITCDTDGANIKMIYLTRQQCIEERLKMAKDQRYLRCIFKCKDCIKGFICKESYDIHMEKHKQCLGDYECDICKQRTDTKEKLVGHMRYHEVRYKCTECGLIRNCKNTIRDHYTAHHLGNSGQYCCMKCIKTFAQGASLRRHMSVVHGIKGRVQCKHCSRTYASKDSLRTHMLLKHNKDVSALEVTKLCVCSVCGAAFKTPSQLRYHSIKHSDSRNFYCVECDKSFKSEYVLKNHFKTAAKHVDYKELPLPCSYCDKRFTNRRDVTRHTNRVHLNVKPYTCDKCDKAYANSWSLRDHKRSTHEGYKKPLRYPCPTCDKVFRSIHVLKNHIHIHTGERPYQCGKCPATFNQASTLRTHDRLIHLKLTRAGKSKTNSKK